MDDPEVLEFGRTEGCLRLFGLPFLFAGLATMFGPLLALIATPGAALGALVAIPFGFIFFALGAWMTLGRSCVRVDRRAGIIADWWGIVVPWSTKEYPLAHAKEVAIRAETRRSKNSTYTVYVVYFEGQDLKVKLHEDREFESARTLSERAAKFAGLGIRDHSGQGPSFRDAEHLDESLRERARRTGKLPEPPPMPQATRIAHRVENDEAVFELPQGGMGCAAAALGASTVVAAVAIFTVFPLAIFFAIVLFVIFCGALKAAVTRERVVASAARLRLERITPLWIGATEIPTGELEELLIRGDAIVARSDRRTLTFGSSLDGNDRAWLLGVLTTILSSPGGG
ncbi:MAG: hypothetical protein HY291_02860 [Planctomycetes bacterium]|nr:hypothetical protein [Planctomycetota bacterium]